jgi:hypothetical protein
MFGCYNHPNTKTHLTYCEYPTLSFNARARTCPRPKSLNSGTFTATIRCAVVAAFAMVSKAHLRRHVDDSQLVDFEATVNRPDLQQRTDARASGTGSSTEQQITGAKFQGVTATILWMRTAPGRQAAFVGGALGPRRPDPCCCSLAHSRVRS